MKWTWRCHTLIIIQAIQDLKDSKSCGLDGVYAEHIKHCSDLIILL